MTPKEFATAIDGAFKAQGWSTSRACLLGPFPAAELDVWRKQVDEKCTTARAEALVCRFVQTTKLDATKIRFSQDLGHLIVQLRHDGGNLAERSVWKRMNKIKKVKP